MTHLKILVSTAISFSKYFSRHSLCHLTMEKCTVSLGQTFDDDLASFGGKDMEDHYDTTATGPESENEQEQSAEEEDETWLIQDEVCSEEEELVDQSSMVCGLRSKLSCPMHSIDMWICPYFPGYQSNVLEKKKGSRCQILQALSSSNQGE